jgi:putative transposase
MKRRTFSAEFKAKIVLELLRGEKELTVIASENEIAPNQMIDCQVKCNTQE